MERAGRVKRASRALGVLLGVALGAGAAAAPPPLPAALASPSATPAAQPRPGVLECVKPEYRAAVARCMSKPTVSTRAAGEEVVCTVAVYEWLYEHPDRVALAWQRLKVPAIPISSMGNGKFGWTDEYGSEIVWQTVGTFPEGRVWYATGKVKAAPAAPSIPVQGVVVVRHKKRVEQDGVALFAPTVEAYMHSDSKAANLVLRVLGPAVPGVAEEAAGQLLDFFGGIAAYVQKNPARADELLAPKQGREPGR
jgi:hypothetical protein